VYVWEVCRFSIKDVSSCVVGGEANILSSAGKENLHLACTWVRER